MSSLVVPTLIALPLAGYVVDVTMFRSERLRRRPWKDRALAAARGV